MEALKTTPTDQLDLIGSRLSVLAKGLGLTQEDIANRLLISRITINRFFKGRTEIRSGDLVQLLRLFGIDVAQLLDERIERMMKGKSIQAPREHHEISKVLEDLDPHVSRTIVDQINWWKKTSDDKSDVLSAGI